MPNRLVFGLAVIGALIAAVLGAVRLSTAQQQTRPSSEPAPAANQDDDDALTVSIHESPFGAPSVATEDGATTLSLTIDMPTPAWTLATDSVSKPDADGRLEVHATFVRPGGMVAQVITRETLSVSLGKLAAGEYVVIIRTRRVNDADDDTPFTLATAVSLIAAE